MFMDSDFQLKRENWIMLQNQSITRVNGTYWKYSVSLSQIPLCTVYFFIPMLSETGCVSHIKEAKTEGLSAGFSKARQVSMAQEEASNLKGTSWKYAVVNSDQQLSSALTFAILWEVPEWHLWGSVCSPKGIVNLWAKSTTGYQLFQQNQLITIVTGSLPGKGGVPGHCLGQIHQIIRVWTGHPQRWQIQAECSYLSCCISPHY